MTTRDDLLTSFPSVADANGRAQVVLQPMRAYETWEVRRMTVQSTSTTLVPECRVYRQHESPSTLIDATFTGTLDTSELSNALRVLNGEALLAVWTGADVGSTCVFTIQGDKIVEG